MITLARGFIDAYRQAEQFEKPVEDRSDIWHWLTIPQYVFSVFSLWLYGELLAGAGLWFLLLIDVVVAIVVFEIMLWYFRRQYNSAIRFADRRKVYLFSSAYT